MNLEEELDKLKVHISIDKATIQELNTCIAEKREGKFFCENKCLMQTFFNYLVLDILF